MRLEGPQFPHPYATHTVAIAANGQRLDVTLAARIREAAYHSRAIGTFRRFRSVPVQAASAEDTPTAGHLTRLFRNERTNEAQQVLWRLAHKLTVVTRFPSINIHGRIAWEAGCTAIYWRVVLHRTAKGQSSHAVSRKSGNDCCSFSDETPRRGSNFESFCAWKWLAGVVRRAGRGAGAGETIRVTMKT